VNSTHLILTGQVLGNNFLGYKPTIQWLLEKFNMTVDPVIVFFLLRSLSVPHPVHNALKLGHLKAI
jgi:hypothetical protein